MMKGISKIIINTRTSNERVTAVMHIIRVPILNLFLIANFIVVERMNAAIAISLNSISTRFNVVKEKRLNDLILTLNTTIRQSILFIRRYTGLSKFHLTAVFLYEYTHNKDTFLKVKCKIKKIIVGSKCIEVLLEDFQWSTFNKLNGNASFSVLFCDCCHTMNPDHSIYYQVQYTAR